MHFNSHAHVERDQPFTKTHVKDLNFNSHAHVERDQPWQLFHLKCGHFNSHAHVERDLSGTCCRRFFAFQLTRSRGAWLLPLQRRRIDEYISTHTLTWSVTSATWLANTVSKISTHTLTWSVTKDLVKTEEEPTISTHTLTWSVTRHRFFDHFRYTISTHTLTWSVTRDLKALDNLQPFQLTRSRGAWRRAHARLRRHSNFNSHAHVERDMKITCWRLSSIAFQLTRSRGAWPGTI